MVTTMTIDELKDKASCLPLAPGVYVMRDKNDRVIYVGKAKKLKNRVSQYFQDTASHTPKTRMMVSKIDHFEVIVAASEFEALILECSLIKRYMPKYNILLKDDKGFPYLRLNMKEPYPVITMVNRVESDGAEYFGPFGSRSVTQSLLEAIRLALKLPGCHKQFPRDVGKGRVCLNYHMNQCAGWCQEGMTVTQYRETMEQARQLLSGNYKQVAEEIRQDMLQAAEEMNFELAASLRDRFQAVNALGQKQLVTAGKAGDLDAIGYYQNEVKACFTVLCFGQGNLLDKAYEVFASPEDKEAALSSLVKQYYLTRECVPSVVLLPFEIEDRELLEQMLTEKFCRRVHIKVPQKGENARLLELAMKNAREEAERFTNREERYTGTIQLLGKMLGIPAPERIESFDISNISGTDIVASMVVFQDGKPRKKDYKRFKIRDLDGQDDYASMHQVISRRFAHYKNGDPGFETAPSLLLIDGGVQHARTARLALAELGLDFPIFGMVKDDRHRTRALVTEHGLEIRIDNQPAIFSFVGNIQEETHRFAITYHRQLRSKRLRYSKLDEIPGVGPKRKAQLLKMFKSLDAIGRASMYELERLLPKPVAAEVYEFFHKEDHSQCE